MIFNRDADIPLGITNNHGWKLCIISFILFCTSFYPLVLVELRYHHTNCHPKNHDHVVVHIDHADVNCKTDRNVTKITNCWVDMNGDKCMAVEYNNPYTHTYLSALIMGGFIGITALMVGYLAIREIRKNNSIMNTGEAYEKV